MLKNREQIKEILKMDMNEEDKIEELAKLNTVKTDVSRIVLIDSIEDLELEEGQKISGLGNSWADTSKDCEYMTEEGMGNIQVVFTASNVGGYEVQYLNVDYLMYDLNIDEEKAEEIEDDEVYQEILELLGTDADAEQEAEILVSNDTEFIVREISNFDPDTNLIEVQLELI